MRPWERHRHGTAGKWPCTFRVGVTLDHLVVRLEAGHGDLLDGVDLVSSLGSRDNGRVGDKREVYTRVRDQVGLELIQIDVQRAIETERRGDRGDNLSNETVQVGETGRSDTQPLLADVVNGLIVNLVKSRLSDYD